MRRWAVILGVVVACGIGVSLFGQRRSSTSEQGAAPASVATEQASASTRDQPESPGVEASASVAAATDGSPAATTGIFRGRLIDAVTRQPVKTFEVEMLPSQASPEGKRLSRTFQSETGSFSWDNLPPDTWSVTLSAHGYQPFDAGQVTIVAGKTTREAVMPLQQGFTVRGRVVAASTGAGIPEASLTYQRPGGLPHQGVQPYAKVTEDGSFVFEGVPGGDIVLTANAPGYASRQVEIDVDEKTPPQDFVLSVGGVIAGRVTGTSGVSIKASIVLSTPDFAFPFETDASGRFSFKNLPPGRYEVSASGSGDNARQEIILGQDEHREDVLLTVDHGHSIHGTVRGLRPEQLQRTFIALSFEAQHAYFNTHPDPQGAYTINGVPGGRANLLVFMRDRRIEKTVDVPADRDFTLDIALPTGARLSGRVTQGGKPVGGKYVYIKAASKSDTSYHWATSADGAYDIEGLPPGEYRITADGDVSRTLTIATDTVYDIEIPSVQLAGRVVADGGSVPMVGADVHVRGIDPATARVHAFKETNNFGDFNVTGIEPGEIALFVYMPGYELYREKISYAAPITNKTIKLRKSDGVEVKVDSVAGKPPVRGLMIGETIPGNEFDIPLWIPLNREGVGSLPSALAGNKLTIYGRGDGKPIVIDEWDGQPLELKL